MNTARRRLPTLPLIRAPHLHLGYADINGREDWHHLEHQYESAQIFPRHPAVEPGLGPVMLGFLQIRYLFQDCLRSCRQFWLPATQSKLPRSKIDSFAKLLMITNTSQDHTGNGYSQLCKIEITIACHSSHTFDELVQGLLWN